MSSAPLVSSGPNDNGGAVVVVTYGLVVLSLCFAALRVYTTVRRKRDFGFDDITFLIASALALPQSIFVERSVGQGLGEHMDTLSALQIDRSFKWIYISQLLGIAVQCLAKVSMLLLIARLDSQSPTYTSFRIIAVGSVAWALFSLFTLAFQCGAREPWIFAADRCAAGGNLWYPVLALNAVTDAFLAVFFLPVVWKLQMDRAVRRTVILLFSIRLAVSAASIAHISRLSPYLTRADKTWYNAVPTILFQVTMNLSLISSGIPSIHRYLSDLSTGHLGTMLTEHELQVTGFRSQHSRMSTSKPSKASKNSSKLSSKLSSQLSSNARSVSKDRNYTLRPASSHTDEKPLRLTPDTRNEFQTHIYASSPPNGRREAHCANGSNGVRKSDGEDTIPEDSSLRSLTRNGVVQKREFTMEVEYDPDQHNYRRDPYHGQYTRDETLHAL